MHVAPHDAVAPHDVLAVDGCVRRDARDKPVAVDGSRRVEGLRERDSPRHVDRAGTLRGDRSFERVDDVAGGAGPLVVEHAQAPAPGWTLSGQHAAKWVEDRTDGVPESMRAMLLSGRMGVDLFRRWDVGALASLLWSPTGGREQAVGAEVGFLLRSNWWLSFGDNAVGFRDNDFDVSNATARGPFTRLRLKF